MRKMTSGERTAKNGAAHVVVSKPMNFIPGKAGYPVALKTRLRDSPPSGVAALGNLDHLNARLLALFCSAKCPGNLILDTYDLARGLRDAGVATIGGFHSPMEKECLDLLLRGKQPVVICPARGIIGMRIPTAWKGALNDGRLLLLSPFGEQDRRPTTALAIKRNRFVADVADNVFIAHAAPGGKTEQFCRELIADGRSVFVFDRKENQHLLESGARTLDLSQVLSGSRSTGRTPRPQCLLRKT